MLGIAQQLGEGEAVRIVPTLLALHALPADQRDRRAHYVGEIVDKLIPEAAKQGLATSVDAFCDTIAFTPDEVERLFKAAAHHGLRVRLHAEQLSNQNGAALAAQYRALVRRPSRASRRSRSQGDGRGRDRRRAASRRLLCASGNAEAAGRAAAQAQGPDRGRHRLQSRAPRPLLSPTLAMNMACTLFGLTPEEALAGMTINAARALGLARQVGSIAAGKAADLCVWRIESSPSSATGSACRAPNAAFSMEQTAERQRTDDRRDNSRHIRARRGSEIKAKSWTTEAAVRMLMNNLDDEVAEDPQSLVVYGGIGRAARNWECFDKIVETLERLEEDQTLLVQSGKPVGVFRTHKDAPRVLIANSNLVPKWANWEVFNELDRKGLMMYGQMTAGSWIYIGTQGIVQGTYETFAEMGRQHYGGDLKGKWILTAGLGGMGGAQPLAAVMAGAHCIAIEVQESRIEKRLETRYLDRRATSIDEALEIIRTATEPTSASACSAMRPKSCPKCLTRGIRPDALTDQTSAHDPANGYCPAGWSVAKWQEMRERDPAAVAAGRAQSRWRATSRRCSPSRKWASRPSIMATTSARKPRTTGVDPRLRLSRLRPGLCPSAVLPRHRPVPLGRAERRSRGHLQHRPAGEGADPRRPAPPPLARHGARADRLPGAAGAHLLGRPRPAPPPRPRLQRDGAQRRSLGARSSSAATISTAAASPRPTARPKA